MEERDRMQETGAEEMGMEQKETEQTGTEQIEAERGQDLARMGVPDAMKEDRESGKNWKKGQRKARSESERYRLTGALGAKIFAFFLLVVSGVVGFWGLVGCVSMGEMGFYERSLEEVLEQQLQSPASAAIYNVAGYIESGNVKGAEEYCRDRNVDMELVWEDGRDGETVLWSTASDGYETKYIAARYLRFDLQEDVFMDGAGLMEDEEYLIRASVRMDFPMKDNFRRLAEYVEIAYDARYALIGMTVAGIFLCILVFVFLMCGAGHQNGRAGIVPGVLAAIPLDVLTVLFLFMAAVVGFVGLNFVWRLNTMTEMVLLTCVGALLAVWGTLYCMEVAVRLKRGKCFQYSVTYWVLRGCWRICRFLGRGFLSLMRDLPLVLTVVTAYLGLCIMEFLGILLIENNGGELAGVLWIMEKAALFVVVVYVALACRKLLEAGQALAEGEGDYKVDTSRLVWGFKEHGENLNSLGQGISKAVAERMRSERLKTELITNVSHDLKTPLTSIINYADLICEETAGSGQYGAGRAAKTEQTPGGNDVGLTADSASERSFETSGQGSKGSWHPSVDGECGRRAADGPGPDISRIAEYAQVLLRQSRRLKKLLEDLLEASKATTGNLEVNLEPCQVGVLLSQAVGEYQQRMEERQLDLIVRQPEEIASIMADGRHLWRVFDNLLNNICKYAQENSRVYLSVEQRERDVLIIFRNMSKYPLDISVEELEERFVRGDKSRHMEGNGLGLSIAKSLVELQGGRMEITIDGDLFKVTLDFAAT